MRWASAHSDIHDAGDAAEQAAAAIASELGAEPVDLVIAFFGASHVPGVETLAETLRARLKPGCLVGSSAHGVISSTREIEAVPALTVIAARLPGVEVDPFVLASDAWAAAVDDPDAFARCAPDVAGAELVLLFGDPFSLDVEACLAAFNRHAPGIRVVGGLASAGVKPGSNALILNDWVANEGGVALALTGALRVDVVVSQGCRPVGPPLEVTRAEGNMLLELDGQPALERAEQVLLGLAEREREYLKKGLYVGRPVHSGAAERGDYLIRNLLGADRDRGIIAIGDQATERQRIRLHVRDAQTAREDLELMLSPQAFDAPARGALLFACNGRGRGLYGEPDRDITTLQSALGGAVPAGGMFCAGEVGPVGEKNYLHGHTASIAIVRAK